MNKKIEQRFINIEEKLNYISKDVGVRTAILKNEIRLLMNYLKLEEKTYPERTVLEKKETK